MKYYIGLDNGGTATKAAVFDNQGHQLGSCSMATASLTLRPEFVERDMEEMWDANCAVVKGVLEKTSINPNDVAGIPDMARDFISGEKMTALFVTGLSLLITELTNMLKNGKLTVLKKKFLSCLVNIL